MNHKENNSEEKISGTSYEKTLIHEGALDTSSGNSPTKYDFMKNETPVTPEKYSTKSIIDTTNKTSLTKEDLYENDRLEYDVKDNFRLKEGMMFKCKNDAVIFIQEFCHKQKTLFVIHSNQSKTGAILTYSCKHGMKRKSESTGKRVIQRSVKKKLSSFYSFLCPQIW